MGDLFYYYLDSALAAQEVVGVAMDFVLEAAEVVDSTFVVHLVMQRVREIAWGKAFDMVSVWGNAHKALSRTTGV